MFLSHVMLASAPGFTPLSGREEGMAERRDWKTRVSDSLDVWSGLKANRGYIAGMQDRSREDWVYEEYGEKRKEKRRMNLDKSEDIDMTQMSQSHGPTVDTRPGTSRSTRHTQNPGW